MNKKTISIILILIALILAVYFISQPNSPQSLEGSDTSVEQVLPRSERSDQLGTYSAQEVSTHNTQTNCWVIYEGGVYDVSGFDPNYLENSEIIISNCGRDISDRYISTMDDGVGNLRDFRIGVVSSI